MKTEPVNSCLVALGLILLAETSWSAPPAVEKRSETGLTIPRAHPRLWWTPERLQLARAWYARARFTPRKEDPLGNALCYVITKKQAFAEAAITRLMDFKIPDERLRQVSVDLYRWAGWAPVVFDWVHDAMTAEQRKTFMERYSHYVDVIRQKKWGGPGMEGNNYYWGYLRNELNWAIASYHENPRAQTFLDWALITRWEKSFLPYSAGPGRGGVPPEGSQYGRYMLAYPIVPFTTARLLGRDLFRETEFFRDAVFHVIYTTTPAPTFRKGDRQPRYQVFPFADDEMDVGHPLATSADYGDFMTMAAEEWGDAPVGEYARHWLKTVRPAVSPVVAAVDPGGRDRGFSALPLDYYAPGPGYLYARNRWGPDATSLFFQLGAVTHASHDHLDAGTFQVWRGGRWLSKESTGYSMQFNGGGSRTTTSHNGLLIHGMGLANAYRDGPPEILRIENSEHYCYAAVDLSSAYRARKSSQRQRDDNPYVSHVVREFLFVRPLECLVIFDRLEASSEKIPAEKVEKSFLLHFTEAPDLDGPDRLLAVNGDQALRVFTLLPRETQRRIVDEGDVKGKKQAAAYYQQRYEETHSGEKLTYCLHVLQARDARGADVEVHLREEKDTWRVQIDHAELGHAVIVFNRGITSKGGSFGFSLKGAPSSLSGLSDRIQRIKVTDKGPEWER